MTNLSFPVMSSGDDKSDTLLPGFYSGDSSVITETLVCIQEKINYTARKGSLFSFDVKL